MSKHTTAKEAPVKLAYTLVIVLLQSSVNTDDRTLTEEEDSEHLKRTSEDLEDSGSSPSENQHIIFKFSLQDITTFSYSLENFNYPSLEQYSHFDLQETCNFSVENMAWHSNFQGLENFMCYIIFHTGV